MKAKRHITTLLSSLAVVALVACAPNETPNPMSAHSVDNGEWITWGGDKGYRRFSPLDQINADNVDTLQVAWRWKAPPWETRPDANMKATPIYIDDTLYAPVGVNEVVALNPQTGETLWSFTPTPKVITGRTESVTSRAVSYWTDGEAKRIFHNTRDGRLFSLDAETGQLDTNFGDNGYVQLRENLRPDGEPAPFVGSSSPPAIVGDVVVAQMVADITSANKEATPGHIRGFNVRTGEIEWTFHTIPQDGEFGNETWENESWKFTGNTGVWSMISVDPETGYIYLPVEAPSHDFYGGHRKGDNLFSQSLVCLDGKTGERIWHFQMVHHGVWDYDPPAAPILHDIEKDGETIPAVTQLTKQGMSFVFNRVTGAPVWPIEEKPVPQTDVPGERTAPTQPFPTKPEYYVSHGYSEDHLIDFTPELHAEALEIAKNYVRGPIYTPPSIRIEGGNQGTWVQPSYGGGSNWNGGAYDPETDQMFVPVRNMAFVAALGIPDPELTNWDYLRLSTGTVPGPQGLPILKPPYASIVATDMNEGTHTWQRSIGSAPEWIRNHPALQGLEINFEDMGQPRVRPAPLATKSLLFMAESGNLSGDPGGPMFRAYDKTTGKIISEFELPEKASGAPMTYLHEGRQYIVIAVASQKFPAELVALALPDPNNPAPPMVQLVEPDPSTQTAEDTPTPLPHVTTIPDTVDLANGRMIYARSCAICHAPNGEGMPGGAPPVAGLTDYANIRKRVIEGGIEMPAMGTMLPPSHIVDVSAFIAKGMPEE